MTPLKLLEIVCRIIFAPSTLEKARLSARYFTRNRKMGFCDALLFFLDMNKTSLQTRLNIFFKEKSDKLMSEQAFSALRNKFDHSPFETMQRELVFEEYSPTNTKLLRWNGYFLLSVDGTYLLLPKNKALREVFGTRGEGGRCVCAGVSVLYDVLNHFPIHPILTHSDMNERKECANHIDFLRKELPFVADKSLVLLDRGYPSAELFRYFNENGVKFLARCAKNYSLATENAPLGDSVVTLSDRTTVRVYKFKLITGEIETLITNLFDIPCEEFPKLYAMRWGVEGFYFTLKKIVCVEKFSGRNEIAVRQDFWCSMVLMIATAVFQRDADKVVQSKQEHKKNKHFYKTRTSDLVVNMRNHFIFSVCAQDNNAAIILDSLIALCARSTTAIQPDRHWKRVFPNASNRHNNLKSSL